ncbi:MAG: HAMP domain-containing sensor histidine kinase [Syntrophales bacterium]|jgi:K+-sensing histidine kinase KdpD
MEAKMEFLDILASTLHDMKNSLGILFNTLEESIEQCREKECSSYGRFFTLQYEIKRLNHSMIRLLSLYKKEKSQFIINVDYYPVDEIVDDIIIQNKPLLSSKGIQIETDCPEGLFWTFDRNLVSGVLENVLNNCFRYTKDKVRISADKEGEYLLLRIEDNGRGYPECMLVHDKEELSYKRTIDFDTGSTGLGIYFSMLVAKSHTNENREGYISILNGGALGGGAFTIYIP